MQDSCPVLLTGWFYYLKSIVKEKTAAIVDFSEMWPISVYPQGG